jgi:hypothetical protein
MATPVTLVDSFGSPVSFVAAEGFTGRYSIIASSGDTFSHTGTTAEVVFATIPIAAGLMSEHASLRVTTLWSYPNNANAKTGRIRLGGAAGTEFLSVAHTTSRSFSDVRLISNRGAVNSQVGTSTLSVSTGGTTGNDVTTGAVNMAVAQDLVLSGQVANSADFITLYRYIIELLVP